MIPVMAAFVLVHSPLLGPTTWFWVAQELRRRGHHVVVPAPLAAAVVGGWRAWTDAVVDAIGTHGPAVIVGHSGAGPLLPLIASTMVPPPSQLVFVDAGLPPISGDATVVPDQFLGALRALAHDGVLPKWSEWFGPTAMEELISNEEHRAAVVAELPEVPLSFFEASVPLPEGWSSATSGAFVLLSEPYRSDATEAASRGWPVLELPGAHLDIVVRPAEVADALIRVAHRDRAAPSDM
jgi:hypothetical protein